MSEKTSWNSINKEFIDPNIARILYHNLNFDLQSYLDLAQELGDPILELGAGLGRVSQALIQQNYRITSLEYCKEYCEELEHIRSHLPKITQKNFKIVCSDMSKETFDEDFGLILLPLRTVNLLSEEERFLTFEKSFQHLHEKGAFAFHLACFTQKQADQVWRQIQEVKTDLGWLEIDEMISFDQAYKTYKLRHRILQFNEQHQLVGTWRVAHNLLELDVIDLQQELAEIGFEKLRIQDLGKDNLVIAYKAINN